MAFKHQRTRLKRKKARTRKGRKRKASLRTRGTTRTKKELFGD